MTLTLELNPMYSERLEALADRAGDDLSAYAVRALEESIDRLEWEVDILQAVDEVHAGSMRTYTLDEVGERLGLDG